MSTLPPLPSSMKDAHLPASAVGADEAALTTTVSLALRLDGPGFKARDVIPAYEAEKRKTFAQQLIRDTGFNAAWLAAYTRNINLDTAPLEEVLGRTRAMDVGLVGDLTVHVAMYMNRMGKLPKPPDSRFMEKMKQRLAKAEDMINMAKTLQYAIEKWFRMRDDMLAPFTDVRIKLSGQYDGMATQIVLAQTLADNEDNRTHKLLEDTALMEFVVLALPDRIKELQMEMESATDKDAVQREIDRLTTLTPLVLKAINTLNPLIFAGNAAIDRFLQLSNMAGGRALVLGLFLSACIARWESDVVAEIMTLQQLAAGLALAKVEELMNAQGKRTAQGMVEASQQYVDLMNRWVLALDHMEEILDATEKSKSILVDGFRELVSQHGKTTSAVQDAKERIERTNLKFNQEMLELAGSASV